jgi:LysR family transcriptional regulator for metE and metH
MSNLEMRHLRMIKTIAETGNLTKAAYKLCISQPALSQQLKDIEEKLGTNIFFRTKKKMILTEIGKKLLQTANTVIEEINRAEMEVSKAVYGDAGELKIGVH